jgi:hypothetical protein
MVQHNVELTELKAGTNIDFVCFIHKNRKRVFRKFLTAIFSVPLSSKVIACLLLIWTSGTDAIKLCFLVRDALDF